MPGISGLNGSSTLQPTTNVDELLNSQKTDDTKKTETPSDVGKTDKTGAKTELEEVVHDDTALNGQTAENFVKNNTVEAGKDKAEKKDGSIKTWFENHPRIKIAMFILEQVLDAVIGIVSGISSKLPGCSGGCITGGLSILKGLAGFHKMENFEKDFPKAMKEISKGGESIANAFVPKKTISQTAQIINCVGTMCGELSGAKSWEDALNAVGKSASGIAAAANPKSAEIANAVKANMGNFTKAISSGIDKVKDAIKESDATNDEKTTKALELFEKTLTDDATLSDDEKKLVKALSDGAIKSIKAKHSKKALDAYDETLGAAASAILKGRNKEIAEQTLSLMKEIRAEKDPFKAALHVLEKAKAIAGGESREIDALKEAFADAGRTAEKAADSNVSESSVQTDVGSFKDRLKNLEASMKS